MQTISRSVGVEHHHALHHIVQSGINRRLGPLQFIGFFDQCNLRTFRGYEIVCSGLAGETSEHATKSNVPMPMAMAWTRQVASAAASDTPTLTTSG